MLDNDGHPTEQRSRYVTPQSYGAAMSGPRPPQHHLPDCLMTRYVALPSDDREYWPPAFESRPDLCTCGVYPRAKAALPEHEGDRRDLEEFLDRVERPRRP
jgi:hypothetical protein